MLGPCYAAGARRARVCSSTCCSGRPTRASRWSPSTAVALADITAATCRSRSTARKRRTTAKAATSSGTPLRGRVVIVDDVITAGTAIRESLDLIRGGRRATGRRRARAGSPGARHRAALRGAGGRADHGLPVTSILTARRPDRLTWRRLAALRVSSQRSRAYRGQYGVDVRLARPDVAQNRAQSFDRRCSSGTIAADAAARAYMRGLRCNRDNVRRWRDWSTPQQPWRRTASRAKRSIVGWIDNGVRPLRRQRAAGVRRRKTRDSPQRAGRGGAADEGERRRPGGWSAKQPKRRSARNATGATCAIACSSDLPAVKDIESAARRAARADQRASGASTEQYIESLRDRRRAAERSARFKPYNDKPDARRCRTISARRSVRTVNEHARHEESLQGERARSRLTLREQFADGHRALQGTEGPSKSHKQPAVRLISRGRSCRTRPRRAAAAAKSSTTSNSTCTTGTTISCAMRSPGCNRERLAGRDSSTRPSAGPGSRSRSGRRDCRARCRACARARSAAGPRAAKPGSSRWIAMPVGNELRVAGFQLERRVDAGAQVEAGGARGRVLRQREFAADARVEDAHLEPASRAGGARAVSWHEPDSGLSQRKSASCCSPGNARRSPRPAVAPARACW